MAQFDANISLVVSTSKALKAIERVEKALKRLQKAAEFTLKVKTPEFHQIPTPQAAEDQAARARSPKTPESSKKPPANSSARAKSLQPGLLHSDVTRKRTGCEIEQELGQGSKANLTLVQKRVTITGRLIREEERRAATVRKNLREEERIRREVERKERAAAAARQRELKDIASLRQKIAGTVAASQAAVRTAEPKTAGAASAGILGGFLGANAAAGVKKQVAEVTRLQSEVADISSRIGKKGFT